METSTVFEVNEPPRPTTRKDPRRLTHSITSDVRIYFPSVSPIPFNFVAGNNEEYSGLSIMRCTSLLKSRAIVVEYEPIFIRLFGSCPNIKEGNIRLEPSDLPTCGGHCTIILRINPAANISSKRK